MRFGRTASPCNIYLAMHLAVIKGGLVFRRSERVPPHGEELYAGQELRPCQKVG